MKHPIKHLRFPKATVETVTEFCKVAGQMLGADAMVDTPDIAFNIGDQGVDIGQDLRRLFFRTCNQPLVTETGRSIQEAIALPTIGLDHRLSCQRRLGKKVHKTTVYRLLKRQGWWKVVPRPFHVDAVKEEQEAFKKTP
jgi:hypothetical protein